jgi:hypothetical protein
VVLPADLLRLGKSPALPDKGLPAKQVQLFPFTTARSGKASVIEVERLLGILLVATKESQ